MRVSLRQHEQMGDVAHWFESHEVAVGPVIGGAGNGIVDGVDVTVGPADRFHIYGNGGFLGIARIQVDHGQDHVARRRICLGVGNDFFVIDVVEFEVAQLLQRGADFASGGASFDDQGRSRVMGRNLGQVQVYGERGTGRFLGAEMIGPDAEHIGHLLSWSVQHGLTVQQMLDSPFYHPVVEEGLRTALRALKERLALPLPPLADCLDCVAAPAV